MSAAQMRRRCASARKRSLGFLPGYKIAFNRKGSYRAGGVASIAQSDAADRVHGVVWELEEDDIEELDRIENPDAYRRIEVEVYLREGGTLRCQTYVAIPQGEYIAPDPEYLEQIIAAADAEGLPRDYRNRLVAFRERL